MPDLTVNSNSYTPDEIISGEHPRVTETITLLSGENRTKGAVLGKITLGAAVSAAKAGGNTGDGTLTLDVTTPVRPGAKAGVYTVRCIAAATDSGTFRVEDPDGNVLGDVVVGATFDDDIKFVIADGSADFIVGDGFDITIAAGSAKYVRAVAAAADGSATPVAILAEDCDATSADKLCPVYKTGIFDPAALNFGAGHDADSVRAALESVGIYLRATVAR